MTKILKKYVFWMLLTTVLSLAPAGSAHAQCSSPAGVPGEMRYSSSSNAMEYCDGSGWINTEDEIPKQWITSGDARDILYSSNGTNWAPMVIVPPLDNPPLPLYETSAIAGDGSGRWIIVGFNIGPGPDYDLIGTVLTSPDGENWTEVESQNEYHFYDVAHTNGRWNVVGRDEIAEGTILTSTDGINWSEGYSSGSVIQFNGIAYDSSNRWVAVGRDDNIEGTIYYSSNGTDWSFAYTPGNVGEIHDVAHDGSGRWIAVGQESQTGHIYTSTDGTNWTSAYSVASTIFRAVAYDGSGRWTAVGVDVSTNDGVIYTSTDGTSWTLAYTETDLFGSFVDVAHDGSGRWIATRTGFSSNEIHTSTDGTTWSTVTVSDSHRISFIAHDGSEWIGTGKMDSAAGSGNESAYCSSADGTTWVCNDTPDMVLAMHRDATGRYMAAIVNSAELSGFPINTTIYTSTDEGSNWTELTTVSNDLIGGFATSGKFWVGLGFLGTYYSSSGEHWAPATTSPAAGEILTSAIYSGSEKIWMAIGLRSGDFSGVIYTSPDGLNWSSAASLTDIMIRDLAYDGSDRWNITGQSTTTFDDAIYTSVDQGATWTEAFTDPNIYLYGIEHDRVGRWNAAGFSLSSGGVIYTSTDSITWTESLAVEDVMFFEVIFDGSLWIARGLEDAPYTQNLVIYTSTDGVNWTLSQTISDYNYISVSFGAPATGSHYIPACSTPGEMYYDYHDHVYRHCDGTEFVKMGEPGIGGAGCAASGALAAGDEGAMQYDTANDVMVFCDGANWVNIE